MTPANLITQLRRDLEQVLAGGDYATGTGLSEGAIAVYEYGAPMQENTRGELPSFVVIQPVKGTDDEDGARVHIRLIIEVYNEDQTEGYVRLFHIIELVRAYLLGCTQLGQYYRAALPIDWGVPEGQAYPTWQAFVEFDVDIPAPNNASAVDMALGV